jgi:hypothetical protein
MTDPFEEVKRQAAARAAASSAKAAQDAEMDRWIRETHNVLHERWGAVVRPVLSTLQESLYPNHKVVSVETCKWGLADDDGVAVTVTLCKDAGREPCSISGQGGVNYLRFGRATYHRERDAFHVAVFRRSPKQSGVEWHHAGYMYCEPTKDALIETIRKALLHHSLP